MKRSVWLGVALAVGLHAGMVEDAFAKGKREGYIRLGYEMHDQSRHQADTAMGGMLKFKTAPLYGMHAGVAFYTVQGLDHNDNLFIPFYDNDNQNYSLLGEFYLSVSYQNSTLTIGRQRIDTPFIDSDDIGMAPNIFEAYTVTNRDFQDTTLMATHIVKMTGIDAPDPGSFTSVNPGNGVEAIGAVYEGVADTTLSAWYYHAENIEDIGYLEATHEGNTQWGSYRVGMQYVRQDFNGKPKADIWGAVAETTLQRLGVTLCLAYNGVDSTAGATADNFLGGGPFFTSDEHMTLAEAGVNGRALMGSISYDAGDIGMDGLTLTVSTLHLSGDDGVDTDEVDWIASYQAGEDLSFDLIYSDTDDELHSENSFENLRAFANYRF